jgi:hypothetical protein
MKETEFSFDLLLQETLELSEYLTASKNEPCDIKEPEDIDYLFDLADSMLASPMDYVQSRPLITNTPTPSIITKAPETSGIIYRIDDSVGTFCVRGFAVSNIKNALIELNKSDSTKRPILKLGKEDDSLDQVFYFKTKNFELAESIREQIINRRFPKVEDSVCNISDPGFSWWMDVSLSSGEGRFDIFFKSHSINRAEKYIQLGPIGDGAIAALRMNQARTLLRSSFPITEFVCSDRSMTVATNKPDHLSFLSFKNIFLLGENHTEEENFPDNSLGRTLYFYFHEMAAIRKFWIEVQNRLS